jgi:type VI secretion system protein ImpC
MARPTPRNSVSFTFARQETPDDEPLPESTKPAVVILGGFSGRQLAAAVSLTPLHVDLDTLDQVWSRFKAKLVLPLSPTPIELPLATLDDLHPERLVEAVPALARVAALRRQLRDPNTAAAAAQELRLILPASPAPAAAAQAPSPVVAPAGTPAAESPADVLARLLGRPSPAVSAPPPSSPAAPSRSESMVDRLVREATASSRTAPAAPGDAETLGAAAERCLAEALGAILRHPPFKALEAAWRSVDGLVRETGDGLDVHVLDLPEADLAGLLDGDDAARTPLARVLKSLHPAAILTLYSFAPDDHGILRRLGALGQACGAAVFAGARPSFVGAASLAETPDPFDWAPVETAYPQPLREFRATPEARHLGLLAPRILLRQPYGRETDPVAGVPIEELGDDHRQDRLLWGSPALLVARLISRAAEAGTLPDVAGGRIGGFPVPTRRTADGVEVTSCAETWLTDRAGEALLDRGIMPVLAIRGTDEVMIPFLRSFSSPPTALPGLGGD